MQGGYLLDKSLPVLSLDELQTDLVGELGDTLHDNIRSMGVCLTYQLIGDPTQEHPGHAMYRKGSGTGSFPSIWKSTRPMARALREAVTNRSLLTGHCPKQREILQRRRKSSAKVLLSSSFPDAHLYSRRVDLGRPSSCSGRHPETRQTSALVAPC